MRNVIWFDQLGKEDVMHVGAKNASLGEMLCNLSKVGIRIPNGFATTAAAYREFLKQNDLQDRINKALQALPVDDAEALQKTSAQIRDWIINTPFLPSFRKDIATAFEKLLQEGNQISVAVRASVTIEDLPSVSLESQQESYLYIQGLDHLLTAVKKVFASLFSARAIMQRAQYKISYEKVSLSVGIQRMVRSDLGSCGRLFTHDVESGFRDVLLFDASYGLEEMAIQGKINPDEYVVYKPSLEKQTMAILRKKSGRQFSKMIYDKETQNERAVKIVDTTLEERQKFVLNDAEILELARYGLAIDQYYQQPMEIEWAKDGMDGKLYILKASPEIETSHLNIQVSEQYQLKERGRILAAGKSIGRKIGKGKARILALASEMEKLKPGEILVTEMTDPSWEPAMKIASAIVTNRGGQTSHAAIVARELGIPAVVGADNATQLIKDGQEITVSCSEGDTGYVYEGLLGYGVQKFNVESMPPLPTKIMMNVADPDRVFALRFLPNHGVGLARLEFIISQMIGVHPNAILKFDQLTPDLQKAVREKTMGYKDPIDFYVSKLREGIATIAAAFYPKPVIVRTSDFKSNEYAALLGGDLYEPAEENPMIGFRGASRYVHPAFKDCFALECRALKQVREEMGLTNVEVMIPFVRTIEESKEVIDLMAKNGLKRGENGLRIMMMCEVPSNAILPEEFLTHYDGFSIGSNDLTQLILGLDRDSSIVADLFDERNAAVKFFLSRVIEACNRLGKYIGICGQAPSDYPELAEWLMKEGIASMSLNPDTVIKTWLYLARG